MISKTNFVEENLEMGLVMLCSIIHIRFKKLKSEKYTQTSGNQIRKVTPTDLKRNEDAMFMINRVTMFLNINMVRQRIAK